MKVKDIMTKQNLKYCSPHNKVNEVAAIMKETNCGFLPVVDDAKKVVGIITDRDICLSLSDKKARSPHTKKVEEIMSPSVHSVTGDENISAALKKMRACKIGRLAVINKNGNLEGILSIHHFMTKVFKGEADLDGLASSGESISRTIDALNTRYAVSASY